MGRFDALISKNFAAYCRLSLRYGVDASRRDP
jgi:hypothetical protein